jgi:hypothetical protein
MDGYVEMAAEENYGLRFMKQIGEGDEATFESVVRSVLTSPGTTDTVVLTGAGDAPDRDDLVMFGIAGQETIDLVVAGTQAGEGMTTVLTMLAAAPIIDQMTDAEVPPAWNGRAGDDAGLNILVPAVPVVTSVAPVYDEDGDPEGVLVLMKTGAGSAAVVGKFQLQHRLAGDSTWTINDPVPVADGGDSALGYGEAAEIELQRRAISVYGYPSPWSATFTAEGGIGPAEFPPPVEFMAELDGAEVDASWRTPNDPAFSRSLVYRVITGGLIADATLISTQYGAPNTVYYLTDVPGAGSWDYYVVAESASSQASVPVGPETVTVP